MYDHIVKELPEVIKSNDLPVVSIELYSLVLMPLLTAVYC